MTISIEVRMILEIFAVLLAFIAGWVTQKRFITYKMFVHSMQTTLLLAAYIKGLLTINDLDIADDNKLIHRDYPVEIKNIVGGAVDSLKKQHKFDQMLRNAK